MMLLKRKGKEEILKKKVKNRTREQAGGHYKKCRVEDELPFQLMDGTMPCMENYESYPKYHVLEVPAGVVLWKGLPFSGNPKEDEKIKCDIIDFDIAWFGNLDVASVYERRRNRPAFRLKGDTKDRYLPCGWQTTKPLRLINLSNISNLRNFQADYLEIKNKEYNLKMDKVSDKAQRRRLEDERQKETKKVAEVFKLLYGANFLVGDTKINRTSYTDVDAKIFSSMCHDINEKYNIDGYITWAMYSESTDWGDKPLFHPEIMICSPTFKMRTLKDAEYEVILENIKKSGDVPRKFVEYSFTNQ